MRIMIILLCFIFQSCQETGAKEGLVYRDNSIPDSPSTQVEENEGIHQEEEEETITYSQIKKTIIDPFRCAQCHSWAQTEQGLLSRISPGEPFSSPFYLRVEDGTMPRGGQPLNKEKLELIEKFIRGLLKKP